MRFIQLGPRVVLTMSAAVLVASCHPARVSLPPAPGALASDAVLLRLGGRLGESRRYRRSVESYMHLGPGDVPTTDSIRPMFRVIQYTTQTVTAVSGDTIVTTLATDSGHIEMPGSFQAPPQFGRLDAIIRGLTITTRMDRRGRVFSSETKGSAQAEEGLSLARQFAGPLDTAGRGTSAYQHLPENPVRVGDTWTDTVSFPLAQAAQGRAVATYRLERIETGQGGRVAVISFEVAIPPIMVPGPIQGSSGAMHVVGEERLEVDSGWIVNMTGAVSATMHSGMGDAATRAVMRQTRIP